MKGDERERLMRFCKAASCGANDVRGRAKFTAHAQWIICVVSERSFLSIGEGRPRSGLERSHEMARSLEEVVMWPSLRDCREVSRRERALEVLEEGRRRQYIFEMLGRLMSWARMCAPSEPVAPVRIWEGC